MDPEIQTMTVRLGELAIKTTAANVYDRINARKARRNDTETINDLEEIINELLEEKQELVRISRALGERLQAARMSDEEIAYITEVFLPKLTELAEAVGGEKAAQAEDVLRQIKPLVSRETLTMMQLIGFDFRRALGEPLTALVADLISSKRPPNPALALARTELESAYLRLIGDPDAYERLVDWRRGNQ